jgi:DNA processing protein
MSEAFLIDNVFRPLNDAERKYAPEKIFLCGDQKLLSQGARVSIIGSREASTNGLARARRLAQLLVKEGVTVVSGLARGIDTAAHKAAIQAGGKTIAVLGTPLSQVSPVENKSLQECISREHLLISQFPEGAPVSKGNFPTRNRLMALISDATVIVEAKDGSGTSHQGWEALRLARSLWIPKSAVDDSTLNWPKEFLRYGAQILSDDSLEIFQETLPHRESAPANEAVLF